MGLGGPIESIICVFLVCRKTSVVVHSGGGGGGSWRCGLGVGLDGPIESIIRAFLVCMKTSVIVHSGGGGGGSWRCVLGVGLGVSVQNIICVFILTRKPGIVIHNSSGGDGGGWSCHLGKVSSCCIVIVLLEWLVWLGIGFDSSVQDIVLAFIFTRKFGIVIHSSSGGGWVCSLGKVSSCCIVIVLLEWLVWLGVGFDGSVQDIVLAFIFTSKFGVVIHSSSGGD